jgi:dolichol-phosphate mannosyltransferase
VKRVVWLVISLIQAILAVQFIRRALMTFRNSESIARSGPMPVEASVSVVVPVLNEVNRIGHCLETLIRQDASVAEILVVDGGSSDGTQDFVRRFAERDSRIRLVEAPPRPHSWNGKAWGLQVGLERTSERSSHVVTIDADVQLDDGSAGRAVAFAIERDIPFLSVATKQDAPSPGLSLVHPSLLSTLAYRFGRPGRVAETLGEVQANGQFAVYKRTPLVRAGGFEVARDSICEDVTLARHLFLSGYQVGFYESDCSTVTGMHPSATECLQNWPRSIALRDRFDPQAGTRTLIGMFFMQVLPLVSVVKPSVGSESTVFRSINALLFAIRLGILIGTRRSYGRTSMTYWLSPIADPISFGAIAFHLGRRTHTWRGQQLIEQELDR